MARIAVEPGLELNCEVDDYLWPWMKPTPVLMHHGWARNASFWRRWVPVLAESRRVYRPEVRGCGKSDLPARNFQPSPVSLVRDVIRVMDALELEKVHWVGESSGSLIGIYLADKHPTRLASLTLCNPPVIVREVGNAVALDAASPAEAVMKLGTAEFCRRTIESRIDLKRAGDLQEWYIAEMGKTPDFVAASLLDCFFTIDTRHILRSVSIPVLLLCGDRSVSFKHQKIMEQEIPNIRLRVFEGYGNAIGMLAPEVCAEEAIGFWESFDPVSD